MSQLIAPFSQRFSLLRAPELYLPSPRPHIHSISPFRPEVFLPVSLGGAPKLSYVIRSLIGLFTTPMAHLWLFDTFFRVSPLSSLFLPIFRFSTWGGYCVFLLTFYSILFFLNGPTLQFGLCPARSFPVPLVTLSYSLLFSRYYLEEYCREDLVASILPPTPIFCLGGGKDSFFNHRSPGSLELRVVPLQTTTCSSTSFLKKPLHSCVLHPPFRATASTGPRFFSLFDRKLGPFVHRVRAVQSLRWFPLRLFCRKMRLVV